MRRYLLALMASLLRLLVLSCMLAVPCSLLSRAGEAEASSEKQIERLIEDLGSDRFEVREAATRTLKEKEEAVAALHKALSSPDAEIRRRAATILDELKPKRARRALARAYALGKEGRIVEMVDRLVYWRERDKDKEGWDSLTKLALQATNNAGPYFLSCGRVSWHPGFPAGDFQRYAKLFHPEEMFARKIDMDIKLKPGNQQELAARALLRGKRLFRAEEISIRGDKERPVFSNCIITASGDIRLPCTSYSVIVAGGDIKVFGFYPDNLIICDGDVELQWPEANVNVIVARGKVTCPQGKITKCLIRSGHTLHLPDGKTVDLKNGTPDPLAFVKFFELSDVGITAEDLPPQEKSDAKGVLLKEVRKKSPFANGLRPGDRIIALEDKKTPTTEIFRRVLRRKLAEDEPTITFTVRRSGKTLNVSIPIKN